MNKGSPGGILLIAFGVLFLRLAYTGRIGAVWTALLSGNSGSTDPNEFLPNPTTGDCKDGKVKVIWGSDDAALAGVVECIQSGNVRQSSTCNADEKGGATDSAGNKVCVKTGVVVPQNTAGQANQYRSFNAAGGPYVTSAGNNAYA